MNKKLSKKACLICLSVILFCTAFVSVAYALTLGFNGGVSDVVNIYNKPSGTLFVNSQGDFSVNSISFQPWMQSHGGNVQAAIFSASGIMLNQSSPVYLPAWKNSLTTLPINTTLLLNGGSYFFVVWSDAQDACLAIRWTGINNVYSANSVYSGVFPSSLSFAVARSDCSAVISVSGDSVSLPLPTASPTATATPTVQSTPTPTAAPNNPGYLLAEDFEGSNQSLSSRGWYKEDYNFTGSSPAVVSDDWAANGQYSLKFASGDFLTNTFSNPEPGRAVTVNATMHFTRLDASSTHVYSAPAFEMRSSSKCVFAHIGLCSNDNGQTWKADAWAFNMSAHSDRNPAVNIHQVSGKTVSAYDTLIILAEYSNHTSNGFTLKVSFNGSLANPDIIINAEGTGFNYNYVFDTIYAGSVKSGTMNGDCPVYLDSLKIGYSTEQTSSPMTEQDWQNYYTWINNGSALEAWKRIVGK